LHNLKIIHILLAQETSAMRLIMGFAISLVMLAGSASSRNTSSEFGLMCTLTGKRIDACCCQQKDGKLYCPLAKQTIQACCCHLVN